MKILVVTTGLGYGGNRRMLLGLSREWMAAGCDLHIISLSDEIALAPQFEECGATVQSLNLGRGPGAFSGLLGLSRAIRRQKPDVVQTWMPHADLLGGLAARRRVVLTISSGGFITRISAEAVSNYRRCLLFVAMRYFRGWCQE